MSINKADFSFIRYANCWEDADLLFQNLKPEKNDEILSIASAGDNSLAFLAFDPAHVLAFDINSTQLYLSELKQKAIELLDYNEVLKFLGFEYSDNRSGYYIKIRSELCDNARNYFDGMSDTINQGVIYSGKFERYFKIFRTCILSMIHSKSTIDKLFHPKSAEDQLVFYDRIWNNRRWKWMFKLFFSKTVMGRLGRDPAFFNEVKKNVGEEIFNRAESHLSSEYVFKNFYLDFQLRGKFEVGLPFYLRPENFEKIKSNINKIQWVNAYLTEIPADKKFDCLNLSNIFEYMDTKVFNDQVKHIKNLSHSDSRIAYWNLLVDREISAIDSGFESLPVTGNDLCFFYQCLRLNIFKN